MDIPIVQIGNSKGIRLSKTLLEKYHITESIELVLEEEYMILKPKAIPRKGWAEAFQKMHEIGDDRPLMPDILDDETFEEWK
jgi:antitoxin MazE